MKNVVVCCDGTGNEVSENISNVLKLYRVLRKTGKTAPRQVVFYDPGVGTLARPDPWTKFRWRYTDSLQLDSGVMNWPVVTFVVSSRDRATRDLCERRDRHRRT